MPEQKNSRSRNSLRRGVYLERNGYYYLLASIGSCCEGLNSTYTTVVVAPENLDHTDLQQIHDDNPNFIQKITIWEQDTPEIVQDDAGKTDFYHAVSVANPKDV